MTASWQPEDIAGHAPFCAHPSHSTVNYCAADEREPATMVGEPSAAWYADHPDARRCGVSMHHADASVSPCVLSDGHVKHDTDHIDEHGHRAPVLVHQSTIDEVARVAAARERACPHRHPGHDAPCIGIDEHDGEHRDEHGCTWITGDAQAAWCAGYDLARAIGLALDADRGHVREIKVPAFGEPALARQFMLGLSVGAQQEAPPAG